MLPVQRPADLAQFEFDGHDAVSSDQIGHWATATPEVFALSCRMPTGIGLQTSFQKQQQPTQPLQFVYLTESILSNCATCQLSMPHFAAESSSTKLEDMLRTSAQCPACHAASVVGIPSLESLESAASLAGNATEAIQKIDAPPRFELKDFRDEPEVVVHNIGRYIVDSTLRQGASGTVYKACDPVLSRCFAVKVPRFDVADTPSVKRFQTEAAAASKQAANDESHLGCESKASNMFATAVLEYSFLIATNHLATLAVSPVTN